MKRFGLHIRIQKSILNAMQKALRLQLPFFQCFLIVQQSGKLLTVSDEEQKIFLAHRDNFSKLFLHGSYWINLASLENNGSRALYRELNLARKLSFTHIILHPGTAKGAENKQQGIDALVRALNKVLKKEHEIKILLENTAHGNLSIGSDILDFKAVLEKLDKPERIGFTIDTSHAHVYGYDIIDPHQQDLFIDFLDNTLGLDRIELIHLNDTTQKKGSRIDRHAIVGAGKIGKEPLQRFILHQRLSHIPVLMELPALAESKEESILQEIYSWGND